MNASGVLIPIDGELLKDLISSHFSDNSLDSRGSLYSYLI